MLPGTSTIKLPQSPSGRAGCGLGLAALAQFLSFALAGAGHGWVAPMLLSVGLWFLIPLAGALAGTRPGLPTLLALAAIALAADALLINLALGDARHLAHYVAVNGLLGLLIIALWLCLWLSWQAMVLRLLVADALGSKEAPVPRGDVADALPRNSDER